MLSGFQIQNGIVETKLYPPYAYVDILVSGRVCVTYDRPPYFWRVLRDSISEAEEKIKIWDARFEWLEKEGFNEGFNG